ncbi:MAG: MBL fold metallo-hydrolase [Actinobacteria bacterium]|nr:MBL fold metallo-hydrolase [Actinomycetota bacterium]
MSSQFTQERDLSSAVRVSWLGHAMFLLEDGSGHRLVTDPYGEGVGYSLPRVEADIVLVSHDHFDHNNVDLVKGNPVVVREAGRKEIDGVLVEGFPTFHDASGGKERGRNLIFRIRMQGLTFIHLGDLGHLLEEEPASELQGADVLFVPVGGTFTVDDAQAAELVRALAPRVAVPMHFRNSGCSFPILTEEPFLSRFNRVERVGKKPVYIAPGELPEPTLILVLDYLG